MFPMLSRTAISYGVLAATLALAACSGPLPTTPQSYLETLRTTRDAKDRAFRDAGDSPVPADRRDDLLPLAYFPADPTYNAVAVLRLPSSPQPVMEMPTSTGLRRQMTRVGSLEFNLKGQALTLTAFVETNGPGTNQLFVPFTDVTTGTETYAGGRYLDLERNGTGIYELDFNVAYHPYCYFDVRFDCPYPPPENRLPLPVRAGERLPATPTASR